MNDKRIRLLFVVGVLCLVVGLSMLAASVVTAKGIATPPPPLEIFLASGQMAILRCEAGSDMKAAKVGAVEAHVLCGP